MWQWQNLKASRPSLKRLLFGGLGSGVGLIGIAFAVSLYIVEAITRPQKRTVFDGYKFSPFELDLPAEEVFFSPTEGNYRVSSWYIPRPGATTTIIVCPGFRSLKADILGISAHLWKAGHNILAFEYHGHGMDVGTPVTLGYSEINDFLGAVAYAKERAPEAHLGVIAYSMGAAVAIMAMARCNEVEALVSDSAFATHAGVVDYQFRRVFRLPSTTITWMADNLLWWRAGYHFNQVEPLRDIAKIGPRPILIIHGGKDSLVDPRDAPLLYGAAQEPKEIWLLPNADHCGAYFEDRGAYVKKIIEFFDLHLKNVAQLHLMDATTPDQREAETMQPDLPEPDHDGLQAAS
ncbi:MAG TPA: alpha/beta hydrolase [Ktedonobacteraceae bacterium]|nr:alpha/beta hydrolase [Ktedonobacteraceae bacterium]